MTRTLSVFTMLQDEDSGVRGLRGSYQSQRCIVCVHLRDEFLRIVRDLEHLKCEKRGEYTTRGNGAECQHVIPGDERRHDLLPDRQLFVPGVPKALKVEADLLVYVRLSKERQMVGIHNGSVKLMSHVFGPILPGAADV